MVLRGLFAASAVAASLLAASAAAQAPAQARPRPAAAARLPGVRVVNLHRAYQAQLKHVRPGKIAGVVYARGKQPGPTVRANVATCTEPACPLLYNNGPVQLTPHIYLLLWGPNWTSDTNTTTYLENFYKGLGARQTAPKDNWSTILSQYGNGSANPIFTQSVWGGMLVDSSSPPPGATQTQIAAEADASVSMFGITDLGDAQIVVATQSGTCPAGFDAPSVCATAGNNCGWHSSSSEPYINLPYLLDAGSACGKDLVNPTTGTYDGFSLVGGADYANTITDPLPAVGPAPGSSPNPAWIDTGDSVSGGEVAGKCSWGISGTPRGDVTLSTGTFAMQSLWSNLAGACVMSDTVTVTNPGGQSNAVGSSVSLHLAGSSTAGYPLTWSEVGLPPGLTLATSTGLITGTPSTAGTYGVTVTAADASGTSRGVSFNWTITSAAGPVKAANGKCLDDSGSGTANGNKVDIWTCNGTGAQRWTFSGSALSVLGTCLADPSGGGAGTKLVIFTCNGQPSQTWSHRSNGEYVLALNGLCLTDPSSSTVNGTQVQIRTCQNFKDQHWSLP
jgi:Ricin-type beta-trefoil lectin domain/Putative Ig domain